MAARTLLFDLDGTLWDSYPWYGAVFHAESGLLPEETIERLRAGHNVVLIAQECGLSGARFSRVFCNAIAELQLYADVPETLETLRSQGTMMGVVTNLPKRLVEPILINLGIIDYFDTLIYAAKKPSPGGIYRALSDLGQVADASVVYVGDVVTDGTAATRSGIPFAWASYGYSDVCPPGTTFVLERFADVLTL